jgi:hypothetical protein
MSEPINVWYSDGVRYEDYRRGDGSIETIETVPTKPRQQCLGCGNAMTEDHQCQRSNT